MSTKEKYSETLMTKNEFRYAKETNDMYIIEPKHKPINKISDYKFVQAVNSQKTTSLNH